MAESSGAGNTQAADQGRGRLQLGVKRYIANNTLHPHDFYR
jgi:hypothetical protein